MPYRVLLTLLCCSTLLLNIAGAADPHAPADPQLNTRGRAILSYFQQLSASPEMKLVSGQFCGWSGSGTLKNASSIHRVTGQWPAMIGLDYCYWIKGEAAIDLRQPNQFAKSYWQDGGLINLSWHSPNPSKPNGGGLKERGINIADLLTPGVIHDRWMKYLDQIATGLDELQQAGVVVIWRPLHEMNGGWFWWGAQNPADFIAVWRHMFDYFTHTKQLHHLIWAFGPNHGQKSAVSYYPGDTYVDLIGLDAYTDHIDKKHIMGYPEITQIKKPYGLTEFGPHGASNPPADYDFRRLLDGLEKNFPLTRHFLCWDEKWNPAANKFAKEFYNDPRVITRDALPAGLAGK